MNPIEFDYPTTFDCSCEGDCEHVDNFSTIRPDPTDVHTRSRAIDDEGAVRPVVDNNFKFRPTPEQTRDAAARRASSEKRRQIYNAYAAAMRAEGRTLPCEMNQCDAALHSDDLGDAPALPVNTPKTTMAGEGPIVFSGEWAGTKPIDVVSRQVFCDLSASAAEQRSMREYLKRQKCARGLLI